MTVALDHHPRLVNDSDYGKAVASFHRGQWAEAIRVLEPLAERDPHDPVIDRLLDEVRFRAHLDATSKVRAKRWIIPWRRILLGMAFVVVFAILALLGMMILESGIQPMLARMAERRVQAQLLSEGTAFLTAGELDEAEDRFSSLLERAPDHVEAQAGLGQVEAERELVELYTAAVEADEAGRLQEALQDYSNLQSIRAGYRDTSERIRRLRRWQEIDKLLTEALTLQAMQLPLLAVQRYEQARALDLAYRGREVGARLGTLYTTLGNQIVETSPAQFQRLPEAMDYFDKALDLDPRHDVALGERRLIRLYLEGKEFARRTEWSQAVNRFGAIYEERPHYLDGAIVGLLYDAHIGNGDNYQAGGDCTLAYDQYGKAAGLPVEDRAAAIARMSQVQACLTPTPTPTNTPEPTAPPLPSATPTASVTPQPLLNFRGKIAFKSDNPEQPGVWVMNPNGSGRQYLGELSAYQDQLQSLRDAEAYSPDGLLRLYVTKLDDSPQIFIDYSDHPQFSSIGNKALTRMTGMAYDPVWSPDGGTIAYVTQENESDDIWLMNADGTKQRALIRNDWEWDKYPSWSPDSTRIVFFSNRNGLKQIYIMDTNGKVLANLSSVGWDEYDPIWIK